MVEHSLGKGEVESSILSCSTILFCFFNEIPRRLIPFQPRWTEHNLKVRSLRPSPLADLAKAPQSVLPDDCSCLPVQSLLLSSGIRGAALVFPFHSSTARTDRAGSAFDAAKACRQCDRGRKRGAARGGGDCSQGRQIGPRTIASGPPAKARPPFTRCGGASPISSPRRRTQPSSRFTRRLRRLAGRTGAWQSFTNALKPRRSFADVDHALTPARARLVADGPAAALVVVGVSLVTIGPTIVVISDRDQIELRTEAGQIRNRFAAQ